MQAISPPLVLVPVVTADTHSLAQKCTVLLWHGSALYHLFIEAASCMFSINCFIKSFGRFASTSSMSLDSADARRFTCREPTGYCWTSCDPAAALGVIGTADGAFGCSS